MKNTGLKIIKNYMDGIKTITDVLSIVERTLKSFNFSKQWRLPDGTAYCTIKIPSTLSDLKKNNIYMEDLRKIVLSKAEYCNNIPNDDYNYISLTEEIRHTCIIYTYIFLKSKNRAIYYTDERFTVLIKCNQIQDYKDYWS